MGMQILDGLGKGFLAEVDDEGHLVVDAIQVAALAHKSLRLNQAFSITITTFDPNAGDTILLIKNTNKNRDFVVLDITVSSDTATEVAIHVPTTEVTPAGTTVTPRNLNTGSKVVADMTAKRDETNNTQGNIYWAGFVPANDALHVDFHGALVLATNESLGIDLVSAATGCACTILGYFDKPK